VSTDLHAGALAAWDAGRVDDARDLLTRHAAEPDRLEALNDLAVMLSAGGDDARARALLAAVVALDPHHEDAARNLGALTAGDAGAASWRQAPTLGGPDPDLPERAFPGMPNAAVMREHALRYSWTLGLVGGLHVLDLGCGTGYGSEMLTWVAASVRGFDLWTPADDERPRWPGGAVLRYGHDLCRNPLPPADAAVMFEVIEHLEDAPAALRMAWRAADLLVTSFPNPVQHGSHHNPYHVNDWTLDEFERELADAAGVRFEAVEISHLNQDYREGRGGMILPGRDPDASYWIVVARGAR
jgi:hypothetical protein